MLRLLGIPSRVVAGYGPGELDAGDGYYHVTESQAHAWTQAYFPGYGWIDFEPSGGSSPLPGSHNPRSAGGVSQNPSDDPSQDQSQDTPQEQDQTAATAAQQAPRSVPWWLLLIFPAAALMITLALASRGGKIGARLAYARLTLLGLMLGLRPLSWQTPQEFGRELQRRRSFDTDPTDTITTLYSAVRYGHQPLSVSENRRAWFAWMRVRDRFTKPWRRWF